MKVNHTHEHTCETHVNNLFLFPKPIGTRIMNTEVLKEPRGFIRCLQWLFAIVAFAACANFGTTMHYKVT